MSTASVYAHIARSPEICGGRAHIEGHCIPVRDVVVDHEWRGLTPEAICREHPGLTLAELHSALAYYHDHRETILAEIADDDRREAIRKHGAQRELPSIRTRAEALLRPARGLGRRRVPLITGATIGVVVLILGSLLFLNTRAAAMRIEINDPQIAVQVDGLGVKLTQLDKDPLSLPPGVHDLRVKYGDHEFQTDRFVLTGGEEVTLRIDSLMGELRVTLDEQVMGKFPISAP